MGLNPLSNENEYKTALVQIESLMNAEPNSPQEKELERLAILVEAYEQEHYPIAAPDPRLEQQISPKEG